MKKVHIFGDSHCRIFFGLNNTINNNNYQLINKYRSAASIKGLNNPESKTQIGKDIIEYLKKQNKNDIIALKFGQVDIEYVYFYKKHVKNENIEFNVFTKNVLDNYFEFINKIRKLGFKKIIIISTNLPIPEKYLRKIQSEIKLKINIDYSYISNNFIIFNKELKKYCILNKVQYLDLIPIISKVENNIYILKNEFRGFDHHLRGGEFLPDLAKKRKELPNYGKTNNNIFMNLIINFIKNNCKY